MTPYQLSITTPNGKIFDEQVESASFPGADGSFGILARHTPFVAALRKGTIYIRGSSAETYFAITSGVVEVNKDGSVLVLLDHAQKAPSQEEAKVLLQSFNPN